ncbi:MAG: hypothetical protein WCR52_22610 [Bacteroidota bacterium]
MSLLNQASSYILGIITEDETVKSFPKEFISEAAKWIKSWFLKDDVKTEEKLKDSTRSVESKKTVIELKLEDALEDPAFKAALEKQLAAFETQKSSLKNVISNANIEAGGNVHIGDTGAQSNDSHDEKNVVKGSTIKAGGDFRLGDDVVSGNNVNIYNNNYYGPGHQPKDMSLKANAGLRKTLEDLIASGKAERAIEMLMDADVLDADDRTTILLQSGRLSQLKRQVNIGVLSNEESGLERNKIISTLLDVISNIGG